MAWASIQCESGDHDGCKEIYAGMVCECRHHTEPPEPDLAPAAPAYHVTPTGEVRRA